MLPDYVKETLYFLCPQAGHNQILSAWPMGISALVALLRQVVNMTFSFLKQFSIHLTVMIWASQNLEDHQGLTAPASVA